MIFGAACKNKKVSIRKMNYLRFGLAALITISLTIKAVGAESDWLMWRGPKGNGIAAASARPPAEWGENLNIKWKARIPGRGHASPLVSGDLVLIATATEDGQFALAYDRATGSIRWKARLHEGGLPTELHRKNTAATATPASDGERFYFLFHNRGRLILSALDRRGEIIWQQDTGPFVCEYRYGYGPSPALFQGSLIVVSEHGEGYLAAFRTSDGSEVWRVPRKLKTSYSSPIVARVAGKDQLLISGGEKVHSYDPANGKILWETRGAWSATCGTLVWSDDKVFASGGFPKNETLAIKADGSGEVRWRNNDKSYEQSMLFYQGHLYTFNDNGIALCWEASTGAEKWKVRLGGPVSASPILANGIIYATNEQGTTFAYKANPEKFELVGEFQLGTEGFATPVFVGSEVFIRTAQSQPSREEFLYCISSSKK